MHYLSLIGSRRTCLLPDLLIARDISWKNAFSSFLRVIFFIPCNRAFSKFYFRGQHRSFAVGVGLFIWSKLKTMFITNFSYWCNCRTLSISHTSPRSTTGATQRNPAWKCVQVREFLSGNRKVGRSAIRDARRMRPPFWLGLFRYESSRGSGAIWRRDAPAERTTVY